LSSHSVAVALTLVEKKQITKKIHKQTIQKTQYKKYKAQ
jgi:hypothetical protein